MGPSTDALVSIVHHACSFVNKVPLLVIVLILIYHPNLCLGRLSLMWPDYLFLF